MTRMNTDSSDVFMISANSTSFAGVAMSNTSHVRKVHIPAGCRTVSDTAFSCFVDLEEITVDSGNTALCSVDGVLYSKDRTQLVSWPRAKKGKVSFLEETTQIRRWAFYNNATLEQLELPEAIVSIGVYAFARCRKLQAVELPICIREIGDGTFKECENLERVDLPCDLDSIGHYAFEDCGRLRHLCLPVGVSKIGDCAFSGCRSLERLSLGAGVVSIGWGAFSRCDLLELYIDHCNPAYCLVNGALFDKNIKTLHCLPAKCSGIYKLPDGVMFVASCAFSGCNLIGIVLPKSLEMVSLRVFNGCSLMYIHPFHDFENISGHLYRVKQ